ELANVAVLGCAVLALKATGGYVGAAARDGMKNALTLDPALLGDPDRSLVHSLALARDLFGPVLPPLAVALAACAVSPGAERALRFASQALKPDFARLNPQKGLARMYGSESLAELLRSLLRVALLGGVGGWVVWRAFAALLALPQASLEASVAGGVDLVLGAVLAMVGSLLLLAAIDVPWQHFQHRNKLKMTKQEV